MASDDLVEMHALVKKEGGGGIYILETDAGTEVTAQLCGKMCKNRIRVVAGDRVIVACTPYDLSKGRITYRAKG